MILREKLLFYPSSKLKEVRLYFEEEGKEILSVTKFSLNEECVNDYYEFNTVIDISSLASIMQQYHSERLINLFEEDFIFIADEKYRELFEKELRFCFNSFQKIEIDYEQNDSLLDGEKDIKKHKKITDLSDQELQAFFARFDKLLYGHNKFKDDFKGLVDDFLTFNKLGDHKILSLFLMGDSGVGKTEVARAIHNSLGSEKKIAKINFGNYSSDNSLNSLIGSPRGYIGSEDGDIFIRVADSDVGVILIDEFEKSNSTLFNYFLDVLENGKMVSSQANEIDLDGFIIVFTSNITKDNFKNIISPELRSRFDYKGYFSALTYGEKVRFVEFRIDYIINKHNAMYEGTLGSNFKYEIINNINIHKHNNMRDLNKSIKRVFVERLKKRISCAS